MTAIHVMLDLETVSTESNAAIISIGACAFAGRVPYSTETFHEKCSVASSEFMNLHVSKETMEWWDTQNPQIRADAFSGTAQLADVLQQFKEWCSHISDGELNNICIWGNGADFDPVILRNAYETRTDYPFDFRNHRCYRTVNALFGHLIPGPAHSEKRHDALADAIHQATRINHLIEKEIIRL